jgi:hypothetical protein
MVVRLDSCESSIFFKSRFIVCQRDCEPDNKSVHTESRVARHFEIKAVRRGPVTSNATVARRWRTGDENHALASVATKKAATREGRGFVFKPLGQMRRQSRLKKSGME